MKAEDLKTKTEDELHKLLLETRKTQFNLRFQKSQATLDNTSEVRKTRRTIARIKTFLNTKRKESQKTENKDNKKITRNSANKAA